VRTPILYSPANVRSVLATLPSVAPLIPDPADEGGDSDAFPGVLRKTRKELYRWIANTHYPHLAEVVPVLERVHAVGCTFGNLLTTSSREQFVSHTAEVFVADDLLRRGFAVRTIERSSEVSPDLHVSGKGIDLAVEVYSPRELLAVDRWEDALKDLLNQTDIPADYRASATTRHERPIPPAPVPLDPWTLAAMIEQTHADVLGAITRDVEDALRERRLFAQTYLHPETPITTTVEIEDVRQASAEGPARWTTVAVPGFSGYSPAGVFRTIVERAEKKAWKRQTESVAADARALVVYLMGTKIAEDLAVPAHMDEAEEGVQELDPAKYGLDAIAFVVRALPEGLTAIFAVMDEATITLPQVEALFGSMD
jgi:hypothetical protein